MATGILRQKIVAPAHLLSRFDRDLKVSAQWLWSGGHYQKTAEAWLAHLDARKAQIAPILAATHGPAEARRWFQRWRLFFLAVSELFGYRGGSEWFVAQYHFNSRSGAISRETTIAHGDLRAMIGLLATNLGIVLAAMTLLWVVSLAMHDASIIDPAWDLGFVLLAWVDLGRLAASDERTWLLALLTTLWGVRLSGYLFWRNLGQGEDRRYAEMRQHHGDRFAWVSLFTVFWLQEVILWFVAMPLQVATIYASGEPVAWNWLDLLGVSLWLLGLAFESIGDVQLARFKADPANAGQVLDRGLWRYTRHPNYFGDFCVWWGLYLIAASGGAAMTVLSPLAMSLLLMRVSGVTLLEKTITKRRPAYWDYVARTNAFFPGQPRSNIG